MVYKAGCWLFVFFLMASDCWAGPPREVRNQRPVLSPYLFLDPTFNCPYWRWMETGDYPDDKHRGAKPRTSQSTPYEKPNQGPGIRPTGHKTYFMNVPQGNTTN
jgi:hypothetical protein